WTTIKSEMMSEKPKFKYFLRYKNPNVYKNDVSQDGCIWDHKDRGSSIHLCLRALLIKYRNT
ncbi:15082_t:CDS:2, partial [Acaulospora morrowiae]